MIRRVEELSGEDNQPMIDDRHLIFEWLLGHKIDDNEQLILNKNNENIEDDTETNVDDDVFQSQ